MIDNAIWTNAASMAKPRNANTLTQRKSLHTGTYFIDSSDNFMPWNNRDFWVWQLTIDYVQVSPADTTGTNFYSNFTRARFKIR